MLENTLRNDLDTRGFVLLPNVMSAGLLNQLRGEVEALFQEEGDAAGAEFKQELGARRLANLVNKGSVFAEVILEPHVLELVSYVLQGSYKLSSLNARSANAHSPAPQPLHCDMAALPDRQGAWVCNVVWMLDAFTQHNGALRVVPGSHHWGTLPGDVLDDPLAAHPQQVLVTGAAGSVIVMNAHLWHGGMRNQTSQTRTAIHAFYCRRDKPQQQYQKQLLDASLQASLSPQLRRLLALDDPENDRLARRQTIRSGFLK